MRAICVRGRSLRVGGTSKDGEAVSQANAPEEHPVNTRGITTKAEEDEKHEPGSNWSPAVKEDYSLGRIFGNLVPLWSVNTTPRVWVPREREDQVIVDYIAFTGQDSQKHGRSKEEESQEAGLAHAAVSGT
jgi:hypothetical protein